MYAPAPPSHELMDSDSCDNPVQQLFDNACVFRCTSSSIRNPSTSAWCDEQCREGLVINWLHFIRCEDAFVGLPKAGDKHARP